MDMFLAMRVDINEMKLYVVPMPVNMTLEIDGFKVVPLMDEFALYEVMSKEELEKERKRRLDREAGDNIICSQVPREDVGDSNDGPLGWIGNSYASSGFATLSAALRHYKTLTEAPQTRGSPVCVLEPEGSSSSDNNRVTRLTRNLFSDFERADRSSGDIGENSVQGNDQTTQVEASEQINASVAYGPVGDVGADSGQQDVQATQEYAAERINEDNRTDAPIHRMLRMLSLPEHTFARDAAPVFDDNEPYGKLLFKIFNYLHVINSCLL
ncbi:uncharacterized protein LOC110225640 [Arabidopsis lyrata subsp. lyrata]|uniref:uncharacterized protein LOC110225640 n=1 Tax=Arabidopsis lyrata subsp. lyrata TaxID=81972 RepID=UPI000A29E80F|nr:uncharacterized protein LOC110225640 [Arabidopsis lyrata subsp. lyrata]|eukprot:XP_020871102.1 uncharacterized protein LOC110225640 [Arabidopsis lyrata subsp. lyrata]